MYFFLDDREGDYSFTIHRVSLFCLYEFAYISITFVPFHKFRRSPLFMFAILHMWLWSRPSLFASKFYCHSNHLFTPPSPSMACGLQFFLPPAGSHSIPQAFPAISSSLSCIAHHWTTAGAEHFITAACREKQTQTRGWAEGLRGALLVWDIPKANRLSSELFGVYVFDLRVLTYCLVTRMQISLIISYLNRHAVPFSNFSLRQYLQLTVSRSGFNGNLSKDVSLRKMLSWDGGEWWEETVLMSTLPRLEVFCSFSGTSITSLIARCGKNSCSEVSAISG